MTGDFDSGSAGVDYVEQTFEVTVANVVPTLTVVGDQAVDEGTELTLTDLGMFSDPGFDTETFTYRIDWGDGTTDGPTAATTVTNGSAGVATTRAFDGSHTYADDDVYTVTVRLADDDMTGDFSYNFV